MGSAHGREERCFYQIISGVCRDFSNGKNYRSDNVTNIYNNKAANTKLDWICRELYEYATLNRPKQIVQLLKKYPELLDSRFLFQENLIAVEAFEISVKNDRVKVIEAMVEGGCKPWQLVLPEDRSSKVLPPGAAITEQNMTQYEAEGYTYINFSCNETKQSYTWNGGTLFGFSPQNIVHTQEQRRRKCPNTLINRAKVDLRGKWLTVAERTVDSRCKNVFQFMFSVIENPGDVIVAACMNGTTEMVEKLLLKGANPNTIMHGVSTLSACVASTVDSFAKVEMLLKFGINPDIRSSPRDYSALMSATVSGDLNLVKLLLDGGANPNIIIEDAGLPTPLFYSVYWGDFKMVELLCRYRLVLSLEKEDGENVFATAKNAVIFSKLQKPYHIARLPLPTSSEHICVKIFRILKNYQSNQELTNFSSCGECRKTWESPYAEECGVTGKGLLEKVSRANPSGADVLNIAGKPIKSPHPLQLETSLQSDKMWACSPLQSVNYSKSNNDAFQTLSKQCGDKKSDRAPYNIEEHERIQIMNYVDNTSVTDPRHLSQLTQFGGTTSQEEAHKYCIHPMLHTHNLFSSKVFMERTPTTALEEGCTVSGISSPFPIGLEKTSSDGKNSFSNAYSTGDACLLSNNGLNRKELTDLIHQSNMINEVATSASVIPSATSTEMNPDLDSAPSSGDEDFDFASRREVKDLSKRYEFLVKNVKCTSRKCTNDEAQT